MVQKIESGIFKELYDFRYVIDKLLPILNKSLEHIDNIELYSEGLTRILNFPEYKDIDKAKSIISFIEDKDLVLDMLLNNPFTENINIKIGHENIYTQIKDCSIVTATYTIGGKTIGKIGVIGPTRMDYYKLINTLKLFSSNITEIIEMLTGK
jgi:heat-inducible transcriptional repressor